MSKKIIYIVVTFGIIALAIFLSFFLINPAENLSISIPGMDNRGKGVARQPVIIGAFYELFSSKKSDNSENWTQFRGADRSNISYSKIKLKGELNPNEIKILWEAEFGEGHGGAAIYEGRVYLLDYDEELRSDMLRCFELKGGEELWRRWYKVPVKRNHGMSRTVPAINKDVIITIGPRCHVMATKRENGDFLWGMDLEQDYGSEVPLWYTGQCPLIDGDDVILAPSGSEILMMGVDALTGTVKWKTPNDLNYKMSHASIMPFTFSGVKMYVYAAVGGIVGIRAEGPNAGEILWSSNEWNHNVVAPSALCMPDGKIFITAGYGAGSMVLQLYEKDQKITVSVIDVYKPSEGLASEQQTPLYADSHVFGIMPKDGGTLRNQLVCMNPADFRTPVWTSGKTTRFGLGPYILADGKIYLWNDDGTLFAIKLSTKSYQQLGMLKLMNGQDAWAPIAIADGYMLLRDSEKLICIYAGVNPVK